MLRILPILIAIPLVASYVVVEGIWTNRWTSSKELELASARLDEIPMIIGDWQGKEQQIDEKFLEQGEVSGYLLRDYVNRRTGETLQVLIICGTPGPTSVHTPDVCYQGAGYGMVAREKQHKEEVKSVPTPVEMWTADFRKMQADLPEQLRIYWSWSADGRWGAPSSPRWHYAGQPLLYKMYLVYPTLEWKSSSEDDTCMKFLHEFLPQANQVLFPDIESKKN